MIAGFSRVLPGLEKLALPFGDHTLDSLYNRAAEATRAGSRGFFFATRYFPVDLARAAHAVYWFCHYTLELGRQAQTAQRGQADLDQWAALVKAGLCGRLARHPVLDVFLDTVDQRAIPHQCPLELLEGARMDLDHSRYRSFSQLRSRCHRM